MAQIDLRHRSGATAPGHARVPPHNLEAEESLLGAMLLSGDAIAVATETGLASDDFYKPAHGHVYDAITTLYARGEPVDAVTVAEELRRAGVLEVIGSPAILISLQASTPATSSASRYARIVEEHALLRRLIGAAAEIAELGYQVPDDVSAAVDRAESLVFDVAQRRVTDSMASLHDLLNANLDRLERLYEAGDSITGVPTGYADLDQQLSGLQPSNLVLIGARPSQGKTALALGMASHVALDAARPVLFFSLEMSHIELTQRLLGAESRVDAGRLRNGRLNDADWPKISSAVGRLADAPLFIDDNPHLTVMEIRAKARRMKSRLGDLGAIFVDYLQLMTGRTSAENRQVEVSEISRGLKILARELEVPVVALSQLSRNLESRADKRPVLADLRESGCLTGDTRVLRADTGAEMTMAELLLRGERNIPVWTVGDDLKPLVGTMTHVFPSGVKPVFELQLSSGRSIKASANHRFLTVEGWVRVDEMTVETRIAVPRALPEPRQTHEWPAAEVTMLAHLIGDGCFASRQPLHYTSGDPANLEAVEHAAAHFGVAPRRVPQGTWTHVYLPSPYRVTHGRRNPIRAWLEGLGLNGLRSHEKFVPPGVFSLPNQGVALFLRHLWATDGSVQFRGRLAHIHYASTSRRLAEDVQALLLRLGVRSTLSTVRRAEYRPCFHVSVYGAPNQLRFIRDIGVHGSRGRDLPRIEAFLSAIKPNTNIDTVPVAVWRRVRERMAAQSVTSREFAAAMGTAYCGSTLYRHAPSRQRLLKAGTILDDRKLTDLATSGLFWDGVTAIRPLGEEPVYDATVTRTHNFVANGIVTHNSLEQDSDVVMFIYRDELYNADSADRGTAEIIVAKHRNGPTGTTHLAFLPHYTRFANMARM